MLDRTPSRPAPALFVEVAGVEPASSEFLLGLLRAQPVKRSRVTAAHRRPAATPASVKCPAGP